MVKEEHKFSEKKVKYYFDASLSDLKQFVNPEHTILIVDDRVDELYSDQLVGWQKIIVGGTEESKTITCFQQVIDKLIHLEADRNTVLVGVGGGVVTDLTGFIASVYMRGIPYAFVPTTLLAQVDASIGGKNGINYGKYKNILGVIRQPEFLLFDYSLLNTLEKTELHSGFAEVIKYACFWDKDLFDYLKTNRKKALARAPEVISYLVKHSVTIKSHIVQKDEFEGGLRRLLNFGHTVGHAVEKLEKIPHGAAVAKGMVIAAQFSVVENGLPEEAVHQLIDLIKAYHLPVNINSKPEDIEQLFKMDKKREQDFIHFILLNELGQADIKPIALGKLSQLLQQFITIK